MNYLENIQSNQIRVKFFGAFFYDDIEEEMNRFISNLSQRSVVLDIKYQEAPKTAPGSEEDIWTSALLIYLDDEDDEDEE